MAKKTKYIFVTGGVLSGVGKGIAAASIGAVLEAKGLSVNIQKCDPYLNTDAGTLNPGEHGEVFVTDDGAETDLDLGHYERFLDKNLDQRSSLMAGEVFQNVIDAERRGDYLGKTVQIVPHIVEEIEKRIIETGQGYDVHIAEIGGTVGDYEGLHFIEALRRIQSRLGDDSFYIHVVFLPYLETSKEVKTRPAQYSTKDLRSLGINPQMIIARSDYPISLALIDKLSLFCGIETEGIIPLETLDYVYEIPLVLEKYNAGDYIAKHLNLKAKKADLKNWEKLIEEIKKNGGEKVKIGLVGKYLSNADTYASVIEAIKSAAWNLGRSAEIKWIDSEEIEKEGVKALRGVQGIIIPGGFGNRGIEGKISAAKYARENKIPYLGLCLGMQIATIEFSRHVCELTGACSTEFNNKTQYPVIYIMPGQRGVKKKGGTMRLGAYPCELKKGSKSYEAYSKGAGFRLPGKKLVVNERHRHRYEFNMKYRDNLEKNGLELTGISPDGKLVEIVEVKAHPFFVGVQFHPEFKSRPNKPHPLFSGFVRAAIEESKK